MLAVSPPENTTPWDNSVMTMNCPDDQLITNIHYAIRAQLPQVQGYEANSEHIAIVGGGWSLDETFDELVELYHKGVKIVALNGAANWLMKRNIKPHAVVVLDAREQNVLFVEKPIPGCKYFVASQCHPEVIDQVRDRETYLFHVISSNSEEERNILDTFYNKRWVEIPAAGTVGVVSIMLMRILGFQSMHIFGLDSCYKTPDIHHAYEQSWNDDEGCAEFWCMGKKFLCSAWQASQAQNFIDVIRVNGHMFQLAVHGSGLLAHMLKTGAVGFDSTTGDSVT